MCSQNFYTVLPNDSPCNTPPIRTRSTAAQAPQPTYPGLDQPAPTMEVGRRSLEAQYGQDGYLDPMDTVSKRGSDVSKRESDVSKRGSELSNRVSDMSKRGSDLSQNTNHLAGPPLPRSNGPTGRSSNTPLYEELPYKNYSTLPVQCNGNASNLNMHNNSTISRNRGPLGSLESLAINNNSGSGGYVRSQANNGARKRENPLYEDDELELIKPASSGDSDCTPCRIFFLLLLIMFCVATTALLTLLILGFPIYKSNDVPRYPSTDAVIGGNDSLYKRLDELERMYEQLQHENIVLQKNLSQTEAELKAITSIYVAYDAQLSGMKVNVAFMQAKVDQIVAAPGPAGPVGPVGPAGPGNLSACVHTISQAETRKELPFTNTNYWPQSPTDIEERVLMGLECSTNIGDFSTVRTQEHDYNDGPITQYRCECRGLLSNSTGDLPNTNNRICQMHLWHCPRTS